MLTGSRNELTSFSFTVSDVCPNGQTVLCCNSATANKLLSGNLMGDDLSVAIGQCSDITANIADVAVVDVCTENAICSDINTEEAQATCTNAST
ncbi:hypothetical protein PWT90_05845 [Aphanocladium album]|nr:hypothetical protein PWT90_05845 [Aphanocladium album]